MERSISQIKSAVDIVEKNSLRSFFFGILSILWGTASVAFFYIIESGARGYWYFDLLLLIVVPWFAIANTFRCFQAVFISKLHIKASEERIYFSIPLYHKYQLFLPFYFVATGDALWDNFDILEVKRGQDFPESRINNQIQEVILLLFFERNKDFLKLKINNQVKKMSLCFFKNPEEIRSHIHNAKIRLGKNIAVNTTQDYTYLFQYYKTLAYSVGTIFVYLLTNEYNNIILSITGFLFVFLAILPSLIQIFIEIDWSTTTRSKVLRFFTFCSGGAFPLFFVFRKNFPENVLLLGAPCILLFVFVMPIICAHYLGRNRIIWGGMSIITSGLSNCVLSIQSKTNKEEISIFDN